MSQYQPTSRTASSGRAGSPMRHGPVARTAQPPARVPQTPRPDPYGLDLQEEERPMRSSVRRSPVGPLVAGYPQGVNVVVHRRASRMRQTEPVPVVPLDEEDVRAPRSFWRRFHPLTYVGAAMCSTLLLLLGGQALVGKWHLTQDDWTYGRPRMAQVDARVGADDAQRPTHFMALNLNGQIYLFECPGGDCTKAKVSPGPVLAGAGATLAPATITIKDVNGDGQPDLILRVQDSLFVYINEHGTFRPKRPDEQVNL